MKRVTLTALAHGLCTLIVALPVETFASPITQKLARSSSSIKFGVESPAPVLQMNGQVRQFNGAITVNPDQGEISGLTLGVQLDSAQLPPDQMLQAIFLQSVIARLQQRVATFRSTSIERVAGDDYLAVGAFQWHNRNQRATIPFRLVRSSLSATELRVLMRGDLNDKSTPQELAEVAPGAHTSSGWARATLVFVK